MSNNNIVVVVSPSCVAVKFVFQNINSANFANYSDNSVHVTINKYDVMYNILYNKHRWGEPRVSPSIASSAMIIGGMVSWCLCLLSTHFKLVTTLTHTH